ncbi:hypothetical protein K1719_028427 [Acacia pycnantha]|nr:hypothetical protein K1719_028427 [Acacia pycnantha]
MASPFSNFKYADSLTVVGISLCTAVVCEAISWVLIYRTNSYKNLRSSIDKAAKKLETMKVDTNKINVKKSKTKKIDRVETSLKESSRDLSLFKFKSGGVVALVLFVVFGLLNSLFEGKSILIDRSVLFLGERVVLSVEKHPDDTVGTIIVG